MSPDQALAYVEAQGMVLMSAKGAVPRLVDAIAGMPVSGSWWGHPKGQQIFHVASELGESEDVLFCTLVGGKVTLVHRRLWPALVRLAPEIGPARLARVSSEHTPSGAHERRVEPFPTWVPQDVAAQAAALSEAEARAALAPWLDAITAPGPRRAAKTRARPRSSNPP